jgi:hypothetical protein
VALSKADVHTIVDSVVTSVFRADSNAEAPAPPSQPTPRAYGRRVSFAFVDQLAQSSPPDSPSASSHSAEDVTHQNRPFKWKSDMMMRATATSPHGDESPGSHSD